MKLAEYGKKEWGTATAISVVLVTACIAIGAVFSFAGYHLAVLVFIVWFAFVAFFRDPSRTLPAGKDILTSPADGVVKDIELIRASDCENLAELFEGRDMLRIGIFLSVFDVHLNRAPCDMVLKLKEHKNGAYHDARDFRAAKENESLVIAGSGNVDGYEFPIAVKQISGAIARRIVCASEVGGSLKRGERYGMIKFGSRTEVYIPAKSNLEVSVRLGDKVQGGISILARLNRKDSEA